MPFKNISHDQPQGELGRYNQKYWVGVCSPLHKTLNFFLPFLRPNSAIFHTLFMTWPNIWYPETTVQGIVKGFLLMVLLITAKKKPLPKNINSNFYSPSGMSAITSNHLHCTTADQPHLKRQGCVYNCDRGTGTSVWGLSTWRCEGRDVETSSMGCRDVWDRDTGMSSIGKRETLMFIVVAVAKIYLEQHSIPN